MLLAASKAIFCTENFGPKSEVEVEMPTQQSAQSSPLVQHCINLGPGPLWCS